MPGCILIINEIKQVTDWSKAGSLRSRITKAWMVGMGFSEPRTMATKRGFVDIESGMIAIGDLDSLKESNRNWCKKMKSANCALILRQKRPTFLQNHNQKLV